MKKLIFSLLIFISCGSNQAVEEVQENTTTTTFTGIATTTTTTTTTLFPIRENYEGLHIGLYSWQDFIQDFSFQTDSLQKDGEFFSFYTKTVGEESGAFYYKESWFDKGYVYDDLIQGWCLDAGFTQEECDNTATYEWENPNRFIGVKFKKDLLSCADEMNQLVKENNDSYFKEVEDFYGQPSPRHRGRQDLMWIVPKLTNEIPNDYFNFIKYRYDDGGGSLRYPWIKTYTFDLNTCKEIEMEYQWDVNPATMQGRIAKFAKYPSTSFPEGTEISWDHEEFGPNFVFQNVLFTKATFYSVLWDCRVCSKSMYSNVETSNEPKNGRNPYVIAIPYYVVGNE